MRKSYLVSAALAGSLTMVAPALAQDAAADANLPTCSATVTDHCMQREHHMMAAKHRMAHHHHVRKHHHK